MLSFCLFRPVPENKILIILPDEDITSSLHPFHFLVMLASLTSLPLPSDATPAAPPLLATPPIIKFITMDKVCHLTPEILARVITFSFRWFMCWWVVRNHSVVKTLRNLLTRLVVDAN